MPARSKAQYRFMQAVAHGMQPKGGHGPSKKQAKAFVGATPSYSKLPEHTSKTSPHRKGYKKHNSGERN